MFARLTVGHFARAQLALGLTQEKMGALIGVSKRTAQRYAKYGTTLTNERMADLARRLHPSDARLAADLAAAMGATLESLGLGKPPEPPSPLRLGAVDSLVCATAEAMDLTPKQVRGGLYAAFALAQELGLSLDEVVAAMKAKLPAVLPSRAESAKEPTEVAATGAKRR